MSENEGEELLDPDEAQLVMLFRIYDVLMTQLRYMPGINGERISDNLLELHSKGAVLHPSPSFSTFIYDELNNAELAEGIDPTSRGLAKDGTQKMVDIVPAEDIERIVGISRHPTRHYANAVSAEQIVYILHSQKCKDFTAPDLRACVFSEALDNGIDMTIWEDWQDKPVEVVVSKNKRLIPLAEVLLSGKIT